MFDLFINFFGVHLIPFFFFILFIYYIRLVISHYRKNVDITHVTAISIFIFYLFLTTYNAYITNKNDGLSYYFLYLIPVAFLINVLYAARNYNINKNKQEFEYFKDSIQLLEKKFANKIIVERIKKDPLFLVEIEKSIIDLKKDIDYFKKISFSKRKNQILKMYKDKIDELDYELNEIKK